MSKFTKETKMDAVLKYISGESSCLEIANELGTTKSLVFTWINKFETIGESAFEKGERNQSYTKEFKEQVIREYLSGEGSYESIANKYGIRGLSTVKNWVSKYNKDIEIKDYNPKGDVYMAKTRKVSYEEKLEIINWVLSHNNEYKLAALEFNTSYAQVYNWVKKYNEFGEEGLKDNRGRNKPVEKLSETDKLKRELELLKRKNERLEMENEVLKKVKEIERGDQLARLGKKAAIKRSKN